MDMNEKNYAVVLTDGQDVRLLRCNTGDDTFEVARNAIGCEWIEIVEPEPLGRDNLCLLIDEEGKLKGNNFINCIASQLYGSDRHGDVIVGDAVIVCTADDSLELLTEADAKQIAHSMMTARNIAIEKMVKAFHLQPQSKPAKGKHTPVSAVDSVDHTRRQPCKIKETER